MLIIQYFTWKTTKFIIFFRISKKACNLWKKFLSLINKFTKMKRNKFLLLIILATALVTSCDSFRCIEGSGSIERVSRGFSNFDGVNMRGSFDVYIEQNDNNEYSIEIEADKNFLPYIDTEVGNNKLEIGTVNGHCLNGDRVIVYVKLPELVSVSLTGSGYVDVNCNKLYNNRLAISNAGSGEISVSGINTDEMHTHLSGSGLIKLSGVTSIHHVDVSGSGEIQSFPLDSDQTYAGMNGSGTMYVFAYNYLEAVITGSGSVFYRGNPELHSILSGSGHVINSN